MLRYRFYIGTESGFRDIVHLSGVWGLGENIVQGTVTRNEYWFLSPTLLAGKNAIIQKRLGEKAKNNDLWRLDSTSHH
jgi:pyruvate,water dikinase